MRIVVMSDIHGNLAALQGFESLPISYDALYCLGDVVGYGPYPEECVQWIKGRAEIIIQGNHERALTDKHETHLMNSLATEQIRWTRRELSSESIETISTWPIDVKRKPFWVCHGSPRDPDRYIIGPREVQEALYVLGETDLSIVLFGHTHYPGLIDDEGNIWYEVNKPLSLLAKKHYLINPGSIGQPRDGSHWASFCLLENKKGRWKVEFFRYPYDVSHTIRGIESKHLPPVLAYRLLAGR